MMHYEVNYVIVLYLVLLLPHEKMINIKVSLILSIHYKENTLLLFVTGKVLDLETTLTCINSAILI